MDPPPRPQTNDSFVLINTMNENGEKGRTGSKNLYTQSTLTEDPKIEELVDWEHRQETLS